MHRNPIKLAQRTVSAFWRRVAKTDTCWLWTGSKNAGGYGRATAGPEPLVAHRLSWFIHNGPIPDGLHVCHRCDVRACVNPEHLFLGTQRDNMQDAASKGRMDDRRGERHPMARLCKHCVVAIRAARSAGISCHDLGRLYGVRHTAISRIANKRRWACVE